MTLLHMRLQTEEKLVALRVYVSSKRVSNRSFQNISGTLVCGKLFN